MPKYRLNLTSGKNFKIFNITIIINTYYIHSYTVHDIMIDD